MRAACDAWDCAFLSFEYFHYQHHHFHHRGCIFRVIIVIFVLFSISSSVNFRQTACFIVFPRYRVGTALLLFLLLPFPPRKASAAACQLRDGSSTHEDWQCSFRAMLRFNQMSYRKYRCSTTAQALIFRPVGHESE